MRGFEINRTVSHGEFPLSQIFIGLEDSEVVQSLFGGKGPAAEALRNLHVKLEDSAEYMYVNDADGSIVVRGEYLRSAGEKLLYLDIIHELVHVKQYREGKDLFDSKFSYVERPTELEAYGVTLDEARKIGMTEAEIEDYLYVEWISKKEHKKLAKTLGVNGQRRRQSKPIP
ncbi:MAG TPA: hypothetical protein VED24_01475 [Candidatus Acidoferrum sp.]|nr:hypothetical protein [Candidatus Acidoferrum sp.]